MSKSLYSAFEVKTNRQENVIAKDDHNEVVDIFIKSLDLKSYEMIGRRSFSTVLRVRKEKDDKGFAMKIVLNEDIGPKETKWRRLRHENILPLLDIENFPAFDVTWFLSPVVELTLEDVLKKRMFQKDYMASNRAVSWIKETTSALNYMHEGKKLSFLNLKMSNVMISEGDKIKLFGFHRLSKIGELTTEYDVPDVFKPPESYSDDGRKLPVEGKTFDVWCLGILSIEIFTNNYLARNMPNEVVCWSDTVYPQMFKILKKNKFNKEYLTGFPNYNIPKDTLKLIRNFSRACLRISLGSRPSTEILLNHQLFERGLLAAKDTIWKKELKAKDIRQKIENVNLIFGSTETTHEYCDCDIDIDFEDFVRSNLEDANLKSKRRDILLDQELQNNADLKSKRKDMLVDQELPNNAGLKSKSKDIFLDQTLPNNADKTNCRERRNQKIHEILPNNVKKGNFSERKFQEIDEICPHHVSLLMKNESSDHLNFLQEMFGRVVIENCQENLVCRFIHRECVVKTLTIIVKCKRKDKYETVFSENVDAIRVMQSSSVKSKRKYKTEAIYSENIDDMNIMPSSSRMNTYGYKIASKIFNFFL